MDASLLNDFCPLAINLLYDYSKFMLYCVTVHVVHAIICIICFFAEKTHQRIIANMQRIDIDYASMLKLLKHLTNLILRHPKCAIPLHDERTVNPLCIVFCAMYFIWISLFLIKIYSTACMSVLATVNMKCIYMFIVIFCDETIVVLASKEHRFKNPHQIDFVIRKRH